MKRVKKRPLALAVCLFLVMGLLPSAALAADPDSCIYVGGVELIGSADQPAYATTDSSGTVKPDGSQDHYNIKWDGATLTLNGANVTGWYSYVDYYDDSNTAAIYRDGDIQISLVGENTVTGLATDNAMNNGIAAMGHLTISGSGSLEATGGYDAITSQVGDLTILDGEVTAEGGSCGISTYDGNLTISGGTVTAIATGSYYGASADRGLPYGIYTDGDCTISGGKVTATGNAASPNTATACGIFVFGDGGLTISGGEFTAVVTGENGNRFGIDSFCGAVISGGTVTATGGYAGIFTHSRDDGDIIIEGGVVTATADDEDGYGIYARTNVIIRDGTVTATATENGGYGVYAKYGDVTVGGGKVTATGKEAGLCSEEGDITAAPQEGRKIAITAGGDPDSTEVIGGSPFGAETVISSMLDGMKYVRSVSHTDGRSFTDVEEGSWYSDAVAYVCASGLMNGTGDSTFSPDMAASRSTVVAILWRMEDSPAVDYWMDFSDVDQAAWYGEAVRWAAGQGVAGGYGDGHFGPGDPVTREQFAVMLYRYAQHKGYDVSIGEETNILSYTDALDVSQWAVPAMQWACGAGIINGTGDGSTLGPQKQVTRAQVAAMLMRFCQGAAE